MPPKVKVIGRWRALARTILLFLALPCLVAGILMAMAPTYLTLENMVSVGSHDETIKVEAGVPKEPEDLTTIHQTIITYLDITYPTEVTVNSAVTIVVTVRQLSFSGPWKSNEDPDLSPDSGAFRYFTELRQVEYPINATFESSGLSFEGITNQVKLGKGAGIPTTIVIAPTSRIEGDPQITLKLKNLVPGLAAGRPGAFLKINGEFRSVGENDDVALNVRVLDETHLPIETVTYIEIIGWILTFFGAGAFLVFWRTIFEKIGILKPEDDGVPL